MEFSLEIRLLSFAVLAGLILVVLYYELKIVDRKKDARAEARLAREELYNLVVTTEAIADSLRNRGLDVQDADILAKRARMAYEARDAVKARALSMQARKLLSSARLPTSGPDVDLPFSVSSTPLPDISEERNELPDDNSLPSSFMIQCARSGLQGYEGSGKDKIAALIGQAESESEAGNFDRALSLANKARCLMNEGGPCDEDEPEVIAEDAELNGCPECSHVPLPGDVFCRRCGHRLS